MSDRSAICRGDREYPSSLVKHLRDEAPTVLRTIGTISRLSQPTLAFFCSRKCSGRLILRSVDVAAELAGTDVTMSGGFHTPVERRFLRVLLRGRASAIVCPARSLARMRIRSELRAPLDDGRLLFLSTFDDNIRRPTKETSRLRNRLVVALAHAVLFGAVEPGGGTEQAARYAMDMGKPIFALDFASLPDDMRRVARVFEVSSLATALIHGSGCAHDVL